MEQYFHTTMRAIAYRDGIARFSLKQRAEREKVERSLRFFFARNFDFDNNLEPNSVRKMRFQS